MGCGVVVWCLCGVSGLWTKVGNCGPPYVYPVTYFSEQLRSECDRRRVVGLLLRRASSNRDLFRVEDAREVL